MTLHWNWICCDLSLPKHFFTNYLTSPAYYWMWGWGIQYFWVFPLTTKASAPSSYTLLTPAGKAKQQHGLFFVLLFFQPLSGNNYTRAFFSSPNPPPPTSFGWFVVLFSLLQSDGWWWDLDDLDGFYLTVARRLRDIFLNNKWEDWS